MWNVCFATLMVYPSVQVRIMSSQTSPEFVQKYWTLITCFLLFSAFSMLGNIVTTFVVWPGPKAYRTICHVRTLMAIVFFFMCNISPESRSVPAYFSNDYIYIIGNIIFAYSNGHLSSLAIMYIPKYAVIDYCMYKIS